jgi:hypothetical protein
MVLGMIKTVAKGLKSLWAIAKIYAENDWRPMFFF